MNEACAGALPRLDVQQLEEYEPRDGGGGDSDAGLPPRRVVSGEAREVLQVSAEWELSSKSYCDRCDIKEGCTCRANSGKYVHSDHNGMENIICEIKIKLHNKSSMVNACEVKIQYYILITTLIFSL